MRLEKIMFPLKVEETKLVYIAGGWRLSNGLNRNISPANKSLLVPTLCPALCQVSDGDIEDGHVQEGVRDLQ